MTKNTFATFWQGTGRGLRSMYGITVGLSDSALQTFSGAVGRPCRSFEGGGGWVVR